MMQFFKQYSKVFSVVTFWLFLEEFKITYFLYDIQKFYAILIMLTYVLRANDDIIKKM